MVASGRAPSTTVAGLPPGGGRDPDRAAAGGCELGVVIVPLWGPDEDTTDVKVLPASPRPDDRHAARLLIIEDDEPLAGLLSAHLRGAWLRRHRRPDRRRPPRRSCSVGTAPDLVILDINLPGETGWSVAAQRRPMRRPVARRSSSRAPWPSARPACASSASPATCRSRSRSTPSARPSSGCWTRRHADRDRPPDPRHPRCRRRHLVRLHRGLRPGESMSALELVAALATALRLRLPDVGAAAPRGLLNRAPHRSASAAGLRGRDHPDHAGPRPLHRTGSWRASGRS